MEEGKIKCYELDFGDTNLITQNISDITSWIESDLQELGNDDSISYTITIKWLTEEEIEALPEWS